MWMFRRNLKYDYDINIEENKTTKDNNDISINCVVTEKKKKIEPN